MNKSEILIIPDKEDIERDALARVWQQRGGEVLRIGKFWIKPETNNKRVALYGYDTFCLVLAQLLNLNLIMVKDELIAALPEEFVKRELAIVPISDVETIHFPKFIKSVTPKLFEAGVYQSKEQFKEVIAGIELDEKLICSQVVKVEKEVRSFILNRTIKDLAFYEGTGNKKDAEDFILNFLQHVELDLPRTFVLDIGYNNQIGWYIIEFNSCWGAGLNFCDPAKVVDCIREAVIH